MAIIFVRHAESVANAGGISMKNIEIPLSERGHAQARVLAERLPDRPQQIWVSEMVRTHQTAAPYVARCGIEPRVDGLLNEFSMVDTALIAGMNGAQRREFTRDFWENPDPNRRWGTVEAESFADFVQRVKNFRERFAELPDRTVIFGHGTWWLMWQWVLSGRETHSAAAMRAFYQSKKNDTPVNGACWQWENREAVWRVLPL